MARLDLGGACAIVPVGVDVGDVQEAAVQALVGFYRPSIVVVVVAIIVARLE